MLIILCCQENSEVRRAAQQQWWTAETNLIQALRNNATMAEEQGGITAQQKHTFYMSGENTHPN